MRGKQVYKNQENSLGFGAGSGDTERYEFECPCGKGKVIETHDNIPGFRDHDVYLDCNECKEKYEFNLDKGVRGWELIEIN